MLRISDEPFEAGAELSAFERDAAGAGAVVSFTGLVRDVAAAGDVKALHLQAYSPMTERGIAKAMEDAQERWPLTALRIIHRTGSMAPGDAIVFVATASTHRRAAFEAADFLMDYLKTEAVFWKKEITDTGERWIEPRSQDHEDRARWARV